MASRAKSVKNQKTILPREAKAEYLWCKGLQPTERLFAYTPDLRILHFSWIGESLISLRSEPHPQARKGQFGGSGEGSIVPLIAKTDITQSDSGENWISCNLLAPYGQSRLRAHRLLRNGVVRATR